jgi:hypothetical protein
MCQSECKWIYQKHFEKPLIDNPDWRTATVGAKTALKSKSALIS